MAFDKKKKFGLDFDKFVLIIIYCMEVIELVRKSHIFSSKK